MNRRGLRCVGLVVLIVLIGVVASPAEQASDQPYRFVVRSAFGKIRGLIVVDGETRLIDAEPSPFEFECEQGAVISGYFEPSLKEATLSLSLYDPQFKRGHATSLTLKEASQFRFSWGEKGLVPRCADSGADDSPNACPGTVPSVKEFRVELERLVSESAPAEGKK